MQSPADPVTIKVGKVGKVLDQFLADRSRVSCITGPLGSGKTYTAIAKIMALMLEQAPNKERIRPTRFYAVRNTYRDLEDTTIKDFRAVFRENIFGYYVGGSSKRPTYHAYFKLPDGTHVKSEVVFIALDRIDSVADLRGIQATGFWLNEVKELQKAVVDMIDLRHGRYPSFADGGVECGWHGMIGDTNACDDEHWYYKLAEEVRPEGWSFYRQPGGVLRTGRKDENGREIFVPNPDAENLRNLKPDYYASGMLAKAEDWVAVNLANEYGFTIDGEPVHPEYIDSLHCTAEPIPYDPQSPLILGIDFGRTPAAAFIQRNSVGRFNVIDEFLARDMSQAIFAPELRRYINANYPGAKVRGWSDPAGEAGGQNVEDTPRQILVAAGIPCQPAPSQSSTLRRAAVANPLMRICMDGRPGLLVSPRAKTIRRGLAGGFCYRRIKVSAERYTEEPDKNSFSHCVEGTEYGLLGEGEGTAALRRADYDSREPMQTMADMD